jgi:hypothetical protein
MPYKTPLLSNRCEVNGRELPPGIGVDVDQRMERLEIPIGPVTSVHGPEIIYTAYYRYQDCDGGWHKSNRRVRPGSTVKLYSYDGEKEYVVQV